MSPEHYHHRREGDVSPFEHERQSDRSPFRMSLREVIQLGMSLILTLVTVLGAWFTLSARVDAHERSIIRLEQEKQSKEAAAGDKAEILAKLDAIQRAVYDLRDDIRAVKPRK